MLCVLFRVPCACNVLFPDPVGAQTSKSLLISTIGMVNI